MAIEDAGILVSLLKKLCLTRSKKFNRKNFPLAIETYQKMRLPRTTEMLKRSQALGDMQLSRTKSKMEVWKSELWIKWNVARYGTMKTMWFGSDYDCEKEVKKELLLVAKV